MPYTIGAAPVKNFNLHASRDSATACTTETAVWPEVFPDFRWLKCSLSIWSFVRTDCATRSISLSVTSHKLATRVGLQTTEGCKSDHNASALQWFKMTHHPASM